jgi:hypothetical protein
MKVLPRRMSMKNLIQNKVSIKGKPFINNREEYRVIITHLLEGLTPDQVKCEVLDLLTDEKGRLEFKDENVILCFWNLKDKEKFLVNLE